VSVKASPSPPVRQRVERQPPKGKGITAVTVKSLVDDFRRDVARSATSKVSVFRVLRFTSRR